jgi:cysteine-rich repeat protein
VIDNGLGRTTSCGVGACSNSASQTCSAGSWSPACVAGSPTTEICDGGIDNDCDSQTDEGCTCSNGATQSCSNSNSYGTCSGGTQTCSAGSWGSCSASIPAAEICGDSIDNNCDGTTDEGCGVGVCGNEIIEGTETCDDGNTDSGDGCSATCTVETDWSCVDEPSVCNPIIPPVLCGNGVINSGETCDDGNTDSGDGCSATCTVETDWSCVDEPSVCNPIIPPVLCGNGVINSGETCDDGNTDSGDGCSATCTVETDWSCVDEPSVCNPIIPPVLCGNGVRETGEDCDDGDTDNGDGCSQTCSVEVGYSCIGEPSVCTLLPVCGNNLREGSEGCDDGNLADEDGCSQTCTVESGWTCDTSNPSVCTPVVTCGNGVIDEGEDCDGSALGGEDCASVLGSSYTGTLSCTDCSFDTTGCYLACNLTNAYWGEISVEVGSSVRLYVEGTNCNGRTINFEVWERDAGANGDDNVTTNPSPIIYSSSNNYGNWTVEWQDDTDWAQTNPPEYYFIATVEGTSESIISSQADEDVLDVYQDLSVVCLGINYCPGYSEENLCESDLCEVANASIPSNITCEDGYDCGCHWDINSTPNCNPYWDAVSVPNDDDIDGDGILNINDADMDGDGILNGHDPDFNGDGTIDSPFNTVNPLGDIDGDLILNINDPDMDGDGILNDDDPDFDGDGIPDGIYSGIDPDGDIDNDGILNINDPDMDGDGILNGDDPDFDGDGTLDAPFDTVNPNGDIDNDGILNINDPDMDGDGILNGDDPDFDGDGIFDGRYSILNDEESSIGTCYYYENGGDTCEGGLLTRSLIAFWAWAPGNEIYQDDPLLKHLQCSDVEDTISCPALAQVPFFGIYQIVITIVIIGFVYLFFSLKKGKRKI